MSQLFGLELGELPEGYVPLRVAAVVECLDEESNLAVTVKVSDDLPVWAALGLLRAAVLRQETHLMDMWVSDDPEDGEDEP